MGSHCLPPSAPELPAVLPPLPPPPPRPLAPPAPLPPRPLAPPAPLPLLPFAPPFPAPAPPRPPAPAEPADASGWLEGEKVSPLHATNETVAPSTRIDVQRMVPFLRSKAIKKAF